MTINDYANWETSTCNDGGNPVPSFIHAIFHNIKTEEIVFYL